jgi:SAM-dependent methyltransferase
MESTRATPPPALPQRPAIWTRYWSSGALHSCSTSFDGNYDGAVERFWQAQFARLHDGDRVLDVGTGNGALPLLLQAHCSQRGLAVDCDAVDLAAIDPPRVVPAQAAALARIRFHPSTSVEALPFPDAAFALATAQYALEYTDPARSLPELARVMHAGARLALLAHHAGSALIGVAAEELRHLDLLLGEQGMLRCALRLLPYLALAATPEGVQRLRADRGAEAARAAFNHAGQQATAARDSARVPDLLQSVPEQIALTLRELPRLGEAACARRLEQLAQELGDAAARLQELCRFALDAQGAEAWCAAMRTAGLEPERCEPLHHDDGALMAWAIEARRL